MIEPVQSLLYLSIKEALTMSNKEAKKQPRTVKEQMESYQEFERFEIIEGVRYDFLSSPIAKHQILASRITQFLSNTCNSNGVVITSPIDVHLDENNVFQPDVIFISNENLHIIKKFIVGAPDLVVEILSPSTSQNDKVRKKAQYERFGVKEYWVVDPTHFYVDQFVLEHSKFQLHATYSFGDTLTSERFSCVSIDMNTLFEKLDFE
jgi:Uma2 family endonuclease